MSDKFPLFSLVPENHRARKCVTRSLAGRDKVRELHFSSDQESRINRRAIAYFGREKARNDVVLGSGSEKYRCYLAITAAGDLILCDLSTARDGTCTMLSATTRSDVDAEMFSIDYQGDICVLPMDHRLKFFICFPNGEEFALTWAVGLDWKSVRHSRQALARQYKLRDPHPERPPFVVDPRPMAERRTDLTPNTPRLGHRLPTKAVYNYHMLDSGHWSAVYLMVDIRDGKEYAVKSLGEERLREHPNIVRLKREVEVHASLDHPYIISLKHHQGWERGWDPQVFMPLCDGTARDLVTKHGCRQAFRRENSRHLPNFLIQCLGALRYLHQRGLVHRDVKLSNILFKRSDQGVDFFLTNFGLTIKSGDDRGERGDKLYRAPELFTPGVLVGDGGDGGARSDIYSFGMAILEFRGMMCPSDFMCSKREWRKKLRTVNSKVPYKESRTELHFVSFARVQFLRDNGLLPDKVLERMLDPDPLKRPSAEQALVAFAEHYKFDVPEDFIKLSNA